MKKIISKNDYWYSEELGANVFVRVMDNQAVDFHTHEDSNELFLVLSGTLYIDIKDKDASSDEDIENDDETSSAIQYKTIELTTDESYTIAPGTEHRTRVIGVTEIMIIGGVCQDTDVFGRTKH